jgi:hypothetical protein
MLVDQIVPVQLDSPIYQITDAIIGQAYKKLVLKRAAVAPGDNFSASSYEGRFDGIGGLEVVIADNRSPLS